MTTEQRSVSRCLGVSAPSTISTEITSGEAAGEGTGRHWTTEEQEAMSDESREIETVTERHMSCFHHTDNTAPAPAPAPSRTSYDFPAPATTEKCPHTDSGDIVSGQQRWGGNIQ